MTVVPNVDVEAQLLLADIRMDGVAFSVASLLPPFCVYGLGGPVSLCYIIKSNPIWLEVEAPGRKVYRLEPGTVVGLSGVVPHWFKSSPEMTVQAARALSYDAIDPKNVTNESDQLLIGHAPLETLAFTNIVAGAVIVPPDGSRAIGRIHTALEAILDELRDPDPIGGTAVVVRRLSETILINIVRHVLSINSDEGQALGAIGDLRIMRTIAAVARSPLDPWTVDSMAAVAGMSRTAFANRFRQLMRDTPLNMVVRLRLRIAAEVLSRESAKLDEAASAAGYGSTAAFIRAFRRFYPTTPALWRKTGS